MDLTSKILLSVVLIIIIIFVVIVISSDSSNSSDEINSDNDTQQQSTSTSTSTSSSENIDDKTIMTSEDMIYCLTNDNECDKRNINTCNKPETPYFSSQTCENALSNKLSRGFCLDKYNECREITIDGSLNATCKAQMESNLYGGNDTIYSTKDNCLKKNIGFCLDKYNNCREISIDELRETSCKTELGNAYGNNDTIYSSEENCLVKNN